VTEVACDEEISEFTLVRLTGTGVAICESLWSFLPRNAKYRARLYVAKGMIKQTIAYPIKIANAAPAGQLRAYICASSPSFRCRQHTEMRPRNSYLLSLGPKTHAHHGGNCVLWGMSPAIFKQMQNRMHVH
jgi:hypothetical protein